MTGLPSPAFLRQQYPASSASIVRGRRAIEAIGAGIDSRLLIILGPCSLHDEESSYEYAAQVKSLAQEVQEHCLLVMRTFLEKPRTGKGWTGLLYDPHMNGSYDIAQGLLLARKILTTIVDMDLPIAYEFLDPLAAPYLEDLVTFGIIGARTSSSPVHRQLVSGLAMPCGFKNCLDGNWHQAINSIAVAAEPITRLTIDQDGQIIQKETSGNQNSYLILRGGYRRVNCDPTSIEQALLDLEKAGLPPRLMIDCSHGNSGKIPEKQIEIFRSIIEWREETKKKIFGMMLESHLEYGNQQIEEGKYGVSVTDPCLSFSSTRELIQGAIDGGLLKGTPLR